MAHAVTFAKILVHIIFSTENRVDYLDEQIRGELYPYLITVMKNLDCAVYAIGGTQNHIHILCQFPKIIDVAKIIAKIKTSSSAWIKTKNEKYKNFHWQSGYGIFSVSSSMQKNVEKYIANQLKHHNVVTFENELRLILDKSNIKYDEDYLWG